MDLYNMFEFKVVLQTDKGKKEEYFFDSYYRAHVFYYRCVEQGCTASIEEIDVENC